MTNHKERKNGRGFWWYVGAALAALMLITFLLARCDIRHLKWKESVRQHPIVSPLPSAAAPVVPIPSHLPHPEDIKPNHDLPNAGTTPTEPKDEQAEIPNGELLDPDGNDVHDMAQGDLGIFSAKAALTKVYPKNTNVAAMIDYAKKYMARPYEYGSNRKTDPTFDCSDFTQWIYKNTLGMQLPLDSRSQKEYVKQFGSHRFTDWRRLSVGDLIFFSNYRGTKKENYADVVRDQTTVTHVGVYLGDGNIIHTASRPTGVRIQNIEGNHLEWRIVYAGRPY